MKGGVKYRQEKKLNCTMISVHRKTNVKQKPDHEEVLLKLFRKILFPCKVQSGIKDKYVKLNQELM